MIYFVQGTNGGPIKIGFTDDMKNRISCIENTVGFKVEVLGVMTGWRIEEKALHRQFAPFRAQDGPSFEWFDPSPELMGYIAVNARPWDPDAGRALSKTSLDRRVLWKAKQVALEEGTSVAELLSSLLEPIINRRYLECMQNFDMKLKASGREPEADVA